MVAATEGFAPRANRSGCNSREYQLVSANSSEHAHSEDAVDRVEAGEHAFADEVAQGFGGAAAQGAVAGAAVEARDRELVGEAVAAMHLDRLAGDPQRHFVAIGLGDCG